MGSKKLKQRQALAIFKEELERHDFGEIHTGLPAQAQWAFEGKFFVLYENTQTFLNDFGKLYKMQNHSLVVEGLEIRVYIDENRKTSISSVNRARVHAEPVIFDNDQFRKNPKRCVKALLKNLEPCE